MRKFILILIVFIISSCSYYVVVDSTGKKRNEYTKYYATGGRKNYIRKSSRAGK